MRNNKNALPEKPSSFSIYTMYEKVISGLSGLAGIVAGLFVITNTVAFAAPNYVNLEITDGAKTFNVSTQATKVGDVLKEQGIELGENDMVIPELHENIDATLKITVERFNKIIVNDSGVKTEYLSSGKTYKEFFEDNSIVLTELDMVNVDLNQCPQSGDEVVIDRPNKIIQTVEEAIPFKTVEIQDNTRPKGTVYETKGRVGKKVTEYEVVISNGNVVSKNEISSSIVSMPVDAKIYVGTNTQNPKNLKYKRLLTCTATAYDLSYQSCGKNPGDRGYGITATGTRACYGTVAVDPSVIPLGSKLYIETVDGSFIYGYSTALDTGGAIKGNKVDLFFDTTSECMSFGRRTVNVYILE